MKKIFILSLITIVFIGDLVSQAPQPDELSSGDLGCKWKPCF